MKSKENTPFGNSLRLGDINESIPSVIGNLLYQ